MCDDPTLTASDMRGRLAAIIDEQGWAVQFVEAEGRHPSLVYTIGLTDVGVPELMARGLSTQDLGELNEIAHECVHDLLRVGSSVEISGRLYRLVPQPDTSQMLGALDFYGSRVRALRLRPMRLQRQMRPDGVGQ
jgi:hypothetical protein